MRHSQTKCLLFLAVAVLMGQGAQRTSQAPADYPLTLSAGPQIGHPLSGRGPSERPSAPLKKDEADCDDCVIVQVPSQSQEPEGTLAGTLWGLFWVLGPGRRKGKPQDTRPAPTP